MRKLLNTLYISAEQAYLSLEGENVVCSQDGQKLGQIPLLNLEGIVCFGYKGCSPALMGKCVASQIPLSFISPHGRFLASVNGGTRGNVVLRVAQIDQFRATGLTLAQNTVCAKITNTITLMKRTAHDTPTLREEAAFQQTLAQLRQNALQAQQAQNIESLLGIEGNAAHAYFASFQKLIKNQNEFFAFNTRTKHPPRDATNAVLSFVYTLFTNDYAAACETVGLDSYIGFYHALRSGRASLACDLVEETRCIVERFVLGMINLKQLREKDFEVQVSGAVFLTDQGRKKVLDAWQEKKRSSMVHPILGQKITVGLLPYVQCNLLAKYLRGEIEEYPVFLLR